MPRKVEAAVDETAAVEAVDEEPAAEFEPEPAPAPPAPGYVRALYSGGSHRIVVNYHGAQYVLVRGVAADIPEGAYRALIAPRRRGQGYAADLSIEENF